MKKLIALSALCCAFFQPTASAAPVGWYNFSATWSAGSFNGQFYYDDTVASKVTQVSGDVIHTGRTFSIAGIAFDGDQTFAHNSNPLADPVFYDAGFYLNVLDLGATLGLDLLKDSGLYDWGNDLAFYPALDQSPLQNWSISQVVPPSAVPEPGSVALIALGLVAAAAGRRRKQQA